MNKLLKLYAKNTSGNEQFAASGGATRPTLCVGQLLFGSRPSRCDTPACGKPPPR